MVHLINPRANHQAHVIHFFERFGWRHDFVVHFRGFIAHTSQWAVNRDVELNCCSDRAAWQQHRSARLQVGKTTAQRTHKVFHKQRMKTCSRFRYFVVFHSEKNTDTYEISMRDNVKVRQTPAFLLCCSPRAVRDHSVFFSWSSPFEGCCAELLFWLWWVGSSHGRVPSCCWRGAWHGWACPHARASHEVCRMRDVPWHCRREPWAVLSSCIKTVTETGLLQLVLGRDKSELQEVALVTTGTEHPPLSLCFPPLHGTSHGAFIPVNYQNVAASLLYFLFHLLPFSHLTSLWFPQYAFLLNSISLGYSTKASDSCSHYPKYFSWILIPKSWQNSS